jgi:hypothetical protein
LNKRRRNRPTIINWMEASFLAMALVYGLVASPLTVECIPQDGSSLVEFIGQDPCHHPCDHFSHGSGSPATLDQSNPEDPCLDLVVDNFGVPQTSLDFASPLNLCVEQLNQSVAAAAGILYLEEHDGYFKLAREPVPMPVHDPLLISSLRI